MNTTTLPGLNDTLSRNLDKILAQHGSGKAANEGGVPTIARVVPISAKNWLPHIDEVDLDEPPTPGAADGSDAPGDEPDVRAALGGAARESSKQAAIDDLEALVGQYTAFRDQTGETLVIVNKERIDTISVTSEAFLRHLKVHLARRTGKVPAKTHLELIRDLIIEHAAHRLQTVHKRIAYDGADVVLDLGDDAGQRVRVTDQGWCLEPGDETLLFRRGKGYGVIEAPDTPQDAREAWQWLQPLLARVPRSEQVRLVAWLVAATLCEADYPIVLLIGPEGSAKSTLAQSLAMVLDPPQGLLPTVSADSAKDIIAGVQGRHVCVLDNAPGRLNGDIEDVLCRISTGAQIDERMLYSNFDVTSAELHAPLIVTAISHPFRQRDTRNRTIAIEIEALRDGFKRRADVVDEVERALGQIRGAVLFFLSAYLRHRDAILASETIPHRMVDWAVAGEVIARELGLKHGWFFDKIEQKQCEDARDFLEGDQVGSELLKLLLRWATDATATEDPPAITTLQDPGWAAVCNAQGELTIIATPTAIQQALALHARMPPNHRDSVPGTARAMTGAIQRLQGVLERAGVRATSSRNKLARWWTFTCRPDALKLG